MSKFDFNNNNKKICSHSTTKRFVPLRLRLLVVLGLLVPCLTVSLSLVATFNALPLAQAAVKPHSITWSTPTEVIGSGVLPFVRVASNGTVGVVSSSYTGNPYVTFADSAHNYNPVTFRIDNSAVASNWPTGTYDNSGNFHLVYQDRGGDGYFHTYYIKIAPDDSHGQPVDISTEAGISNTLLPSIAVTSDGQTLYVGNEENRSTTGVFYSSDGGNTWGNNITTGHAANPGQSHPRIIVDTANNPHMVFCDPTDVWSFDRNSTGNWTSTKIDLLGTPGGRGFVPDVAVAPNGDLQAAWEEDLQSGVGSFKEISAVHWNHSTNQWQNEVQNVSNSSSSLGHFYPGVTIDPNGTIWVGFESVTPSGYDGAEYALSTDNGQTFASATQAIPALYSRAGAVSMASGIGNVYLVEQLDAGNGYGIYLVSTPIAGSPTPTPTATTPAQPTPTFTPIPNARYTYYLPFLANNFSPTGQNQNNGFSSFVAFQNVGTAGAYVQVLYYDTSGNSVPTPAGTCSGIAQNGECVVSNPFTAGQKGSGMVISSQPLQVIVAEATPYGGSAYAVGVGGANSLVAPFAINGDLGFITQLTVYNGSGTVASNVQVQYYDRNGNLQTTATQTLASLAPHTGITLDQSAASSNLPASFDGWALITAPQGSQLVAQVLEQNPANKFVAIANAQSKAQTTLYAPAIFNGAFGGFATGTNVINPSSTPVTVTITYFDNIGNALNTQPFTLSPFAIQPIFQGSSSGGIGLPSGGLPGGTSGYAGAAIVSATGNGVVMTVNEGGGTTSNGFSRSGVYSAAAIPSNSIGLPVMANNGGGFTTGTTIFNTSASQQSGLIQYYNTDGTPAGIPQTFAIPAHASYTAFQGAGSQGLPSGFYGIAVISETTGNPTTATINSGGRIRPKLSITSDFIITTNAQSPSFFYTYTEPGT